MSKACGKLVTSAKIALRKKISRHRDNIVGKGHKFQENPTLGPLSKQMKCEPKRLVRRIKKPKLVQ